MANTARPVSMSSHDRKQLEKAETVLTDVVTGRKTSPDEAADALKGVTRMLAKYEGEK